MRSHLAVSLGIISLAVAAACVCVLVSMIARWWIRGTDTLDGYAGPDLLIRRIDTRGDNIMAGLCDDPANLPDVTAEDPEKAAYALLDRGHVTDDTKALACAVLALVRETRMMRRDMNKLGGKTPTMKGK